MEYIIALLIINLLISLKQMATQQELAAELTALTATVAKIGTETSALITKLADVETALANAGQVGPEVQAALDALKSQVNVVDGLVPDATTDSSEG